MPQVDPELNTLTYSSTQIRPEEGKAIPAQIRVLTVPYRGEVKIHIREFYIKDGAYVPGRGVNFKHEHLEEIIQGLILAQETLEGGAIAIDSNNS